MKINWEMFLTVVLAIVVASLVKEFVIDKAIQSLDME